MSGAVARVNGWPMEGLLLLAAMGLSDTRLTTGMGEYGRIRFYGNISDSPSTQERSIIIIWLGGHHVFYFRDQEPQCFLHFLLYHRVLMIL